MQLLAAPNFCPRPELAHRLVGPAGVGDVVGRLAVGLDRKPQAVLVGQRLHVAGIVLHQQIGDRLPQVPEEPLGDLQAIDHAAGDHRQERQADRSRGGGGTPRASAASSSASRPPNCRCAWRPACWPHQRPLSATSLAIRPAKWASMPAWLSLSHSRPRPASGAGWLSLPVVVWPMRRIVHFPGGTSQASLPPASMLGRQLDDPARAESHKSAGDAGNVAGSGGICCTA